MLKEHLIELSVGVGMADISTSSMSPALPEDSVLGSIA
uniref:Uncharacterized protein n=1 Tax=Moniliophthora roreri TaxID=221103 RepID=A0A0W0FHW5_MONRR